MKQPLTLHVLGLDSVDMLIGTYPGCEHNHDDDLTAADLEAAKADLIARTDAAEAADHVAALARTRVDDLKGQLSEVKKLAASACNEVAAGRLTIDDASAKLVRLPIIEQSIPLAEAEATRLRYAASDAAQLQRHAADRTRLIEAAQVFQELREQAEALAPMIARYCELSWADGVLLRPADPETAGDDE